MTDDLTTLLRDAGREPTIDLDVDSVHARGRRRAVGRNVATGVGALAVLGVLGLGVTTLLDAPEAPLIDQAPSEVPVDASPAPTAAGPVAGISAPATTPADVATTFGTAVHELAFDEDSFDGFDVTVTTPDGVSTGRWTEDAQQLGSPVVADDGAVWAMAPDGRTVRRDPATGEVTTIADPGDSGTGWLPIGRHDDGLGSVLVTEIGLLSVELAEPSGVYVATADGQRPFAPFPAVDDAALGSDEYLHAAAAAPEELVVLAVVGESHRAVLLPSGQDGRELLSTVGSAAWLVDVATAGREAWVAGFDEATGPTLHRIGFDSLDAVPVALPDGVVDIDRVAASPDGAVVAVRVRTATDETATLVLDVARVRSGAEDAVRVLDTTALVDLVPWAPSDDAPLAACAEDEDASLNAPPSGFGGQVWWLCNDATALLGDGVAYPFVATELFSGGDGTMPADGPGAVIEAWAAGPPVEAQAFGLSGGLDPEVATIAGVTVEGRTVVVDLDPGPQVGVLGATYASGAFVQGLVGTALQYEELSAVRITLEGDCEAFAGLVEDSGCREYDESYAPWTQGTHDGGTVEATDLEDGRVPVHLHELDIDGRVLVVDVIQFLTGEEASAAWEGEEGGPPNDYLILNENPRLRRLSVAPDVQVQLVDLQGSGTAELEPGTFDELPDYVSTGPAGDGGSLWYAPFWLTIENGVITAIEEQYLP